MKSKQNKTKHPQNEFEFFVLMAYQPFLGYLIPKSFSEKNNSGTI